MCKQHRASALNAHHWLTQPHASTTCLLQVGYCPELALQGGTPSYLLPLLTFNHLQQLWQEAEPVLSVERLHCHVITLQQQFLDGLDAAGHPAINSQTLLTSQVRPDVAPLLRFLPVVLAAALLRKHTHAAWPLFTMLSSRFLPPISAAGPCHPLPHAVLCPA